MNMNDTKPWYKSNTIIVSILTMIIGSADTITSIIPPKYAGIAVAVIGAANLLLRLFSTSQPIAK